MTHSITIDAGRLDVHVAGSSDGAPVLLLHGFPQGADCWDLLVPALTGAGYRTIAPDQRGYSPGARPPGRTSYRLDALVADAVAVLDELGGGRVHLVGHDWGAVVAWRLAARHPERVRTLTALSVPPAAAFARSLATSRQLLASWYFAVLQLPWLPERLLSGRPFSPVLAAALRRGGQTRERAERDARRLAEPGALTAALHWYRAVSTRRPVADPQVAVPTLFVWSDGDRFVTRPSIESAHRQAGGHYRYAELRGVSHWIPEEVPDKLAELLLPHLAEHPG